MFSIIVPVLFFGAVLYTRARMGHFRFVNLLRRIIGLSFVSFPILGILMEIAGLVWPEFADG